MLQTFRQHHHLIAIAAFFPLFLTMITGMGYTLREENSEYQANLLTLIFYSRS